MSCSKLSPHSFQTISVLKSAMHPIYFHWLRKISKDNWFNIDMKLPEFKKKTLEVENNFFIILALEKPTKTAK